MPALKEAEESVSADAGDEVDSAASTEEGDEEAAEEE